MQVSDCRSVIQLVWGGGGRGRGDAMDACMQDAKHRTSSEFQQAVACGRVAVGGRQWMHACRMQSIAQPEVGSSSRQRISTTPCHCAMQPSYPVVACAVRADLHQPHTLQQPAPLEWQQKGLHGAAHTHVLTHLFKDTTSHILTLSFRHTCSLTSALCPGRSAEPRQKLRVNHMPLH